MVNRFQAALELLGHHMAVRDMSRGRFKVVCSCGYESTQRATQVEAAKTAIWHARQVRNELLEQQANGVSLPESVREAL